MSSFDPPSPAALVWSLPHIRVRILSYLRPQDLLNTLTLSKENFNVVVDVMFREMNHWSYTRLKDHCRSIQRLRRYTLAVRYLETAAELSTAKGPSIFMTFPNLLKAYTSDCAHRAFGEIREAYKYLELVRPPDSTAAGYFNFIRNYAISPISAPILMYGEHETFPPGWDIQVKAGSIDCSDELIGRDQTELTPREVVDKLMEAWLDEKGIFSQPFKKFRIQAPVTRKKLVDTIEKVSQMGQKLPQHLSVTLVSSEGPIEGHEQQGPALEDPNRDGNVNDVQANIQGEPDVIPPAPVLDDLKMVEILCEHFEGLELYIHQNSDLYPKYSLHDLLCHEPIDWSKKQSKLKRLLLSIDVSENYAPFYIPRSTRSRSSSSSSSDPSSPSPRSGSPPNTTPQPSLHLDSLTLLLYPPIPSETPPEWTFTQYLPSMSFFAQATLHQFGTNPNCEYTIRVKQWGPRRDELLSRSLTDLLRKEIREIEHRESVDRRPGWRLIGGSGREDRVVGEKRIIKKARGRNYTGW
ncbi:hypothetical protein V866_005131 [Kwoniella sp. B9012]|uniref:F-box domain-containing protein n=1 Tax=Kwoniella europaea PYCC6329 TaxID=1423913 RepID=A0AAX4KNX8_9TREE